MYAYVCDLVLPVRLNEIRMTHDEAFGAMLQSQTKWKHEDLGCSRSKQAKAWIILDNNLESSAQGKQKAKLSQSTRMLTVSASKRLALVR